MNNLNTLSQQSPVTANGSLETLENEHSQLLQRHYKEKNTEEVMLQIEAFIQKGRAAGAVLYRREDRWALQGLLDYWSATLHRAGRVPPEATLVKFNTDLAPKFRNEQCPYIG